MSAPLTFAQRLVKWQLQHGRHGLPWQSPRNPYRVWVSEIMLQQTQVQTVMTYFEAFMRRFPHLHDLALASEDEVLAAWSGLGYYSRARHLHRCARQVVDQWGGVLPQRAEQLATLPGIGPSTAAAIASLCHGEQVAIFDGNVQRVLARWSAFEGDLALGLSRRGLQQLAQQVLPADAESMPTYTQGLMDLGATICRPRQADCERCPVASDCRARQRGLVLNYPIKSRTLKRRSESWVLLQLLTRSGEVALVQRPSQGVWARLWCLPMFVTDAEALALLPTALHSQVNWQAPTKHVLTHRDWWLTVGTLIVGEPIAGDGLQWLTLNEALTKALPQPVRTLLQSATNPLC